MPYLPSRRLTPVYSSVFFLARFLFFFAGGPISSSDPKSSPFASLPYSSSSSIRHKSTKYRNRNIPTRTFCRIRKLRTFIPNFFMVKQIECPCDPLYAQKVNTESHPEFFYGKTNWMSLWPTIRSKGEYWISYQKMSNDFSYHNIYKQIRFRSVVGCRIHIKFNM